MSSLAAPRSNRERWALIDATRDPDGLSLTTWIAGVPILLRLLRQAARAGCRGAVIVGAHEGVVALLDSADLRDGFTIEYLPASDRPDGSRELVRLDARAVYMSKELVEAAASGRTPTPLIEITSHSDAQKANRELVRRTRKSVDEDGFVAYFAFRPISRAITRVLLDTRITPNQVSLFAMALGIAAGICAGIGGNLVALAGVLYWVGAVVDCVDGELARARVQGSKMGEWLDTLADDVATFGVLAGLGIGMARDGYAPAWAWAAVGSAALGCLLNAKIYFDLSRWGMPIDTSVYPWFFGSPASGDAKKRAFGRIVYIFNFMFRRDAVVTGVAACFILGIREVAAIAQIAGVAVFAIMFLVHGIVMSVRRRPGEASFWTLAFFGIKDVFTIINLLGGVSGIYFALQGNLTWAGYAILGGYLLGDVLDGPIARWSGTANRFGREFDAAADHVAQSIAPSIIVYVALAQDGHQTFGLVLLAVLITTAVIRQARFAVVSFENPLTYCGLPRTVSGLISVALPNSVLFYEHAWFGYRGAAAILVVVAILNLSPIPYTTHKGRALQSYVKPFVAAFLVIPPIMIVFAPTFVFDFLFVVTFGYALAGWIPLHPDERRAFWVEYKRWSIEVESRK